VLITAAAVVWWGLVAPLGPDELAVADVEHVNGLPVATAVDAHSDAADPLAVDTYRTVWALDLQRPLFDPPPPPVPTPPPPPPLTAKLQGTIIEPGYSRAIFTTPSGQTQLLAVGQTVEGGAQVLAIERDLVRVRYLDREMELRVESPGSPGNPGSPANTSAPNIGPGQRRRP
jgi:hypothetical protein